jgi:urea-proton symporter
MLSGNLVAILSSAFIHYVWSVFIDPQDYDFSMLDANIKLVEEDLRGLGAEEKDVKMLNRAERWMLRRGYAISLVLILIWPVLSVPAGVFSPSYFAFWVLVSIAWAFAAAITMFLLPLIESAEEINTVLSGIYYWATGKEAPQAHDPNEDMPVAEGKVLDEKKGDSAEGSDQEA